VTEYEIEVLRELKALRQSMPDGARPQDFGGSSNSHHAQTAIRMIPKGWTERSYGTGWGQPRSPHAARGSCRYRITEAGEKAYDNTLALQRAAKRLKAKDPTT
jgi:hypothetical protein